MTWYTADKDEVAQKIKAAADTCKEGLSDQCERMRAYVRAFEDGQNVETEETLSEIGSFRDLTCGGARSKYNIIRSLCSSAYNRISEIRPGVECITVGGTVERKHRAKMMNDIIRGLFAQTKVHHKMQKAFLHCVVRDVGIVHVFEEKGQPKVEVIDPTEILFDQEDARNKPPSSILRRKLVDRLTLKAQFEKHAKAIDSLPPHMDLLREPTEVKDNIEVIEGFRLATEEGEENGRHSIVAGDLVLYDEVYTKSRYPYVFIVFEPRVTSSVFGTGVANILYSLQYTINSLIDTIEGDMKRSAPMLMIYDDSEVTEEDAASNERMRIVRVRTAGLEPKIIFPQSVSPEMERKLKQYEQSAYEIVGISQPSSRGAVPAGLDSGKAIRAHEDVQDSRFVVSKQNYRDAHVEVAELLLGVCQKISENDENYEVQYKSKGAIERVKWKEVIKDLSDFVLEVKPIGALSGSLPGRMQEAKEMMDIGLVETKEQAASLLDFPDLEKYRSFALAENDAIESIIESLFVPGADPIEPDPYLPVEKLRAHAQKAYAKALVEELPEETIDILRDFMDRCDVIIEERMAQKSMTQQQPVAAPQEAQQQQQAPMG
jgi:hypothetical protein